MFPCLLEACCCSVPRSWDSTEEASTSSGRKHNNCSGKAGPIWLKRQGKFADHVALFLNIPVTSAEVERSFSLAGCIDTKLRHALPDETRKLSTMLMFNGDIEGRFR
eukprot:EG_transcript_12786